MLWPPLDAPALLPEACAPPDGVPPAPPAANAPAIALAPALTPEAGAAPAAEAPAAEPVLEAGSELHAAHARTNAQSLARGIGQFAMFDEIRSRFDFCNTDL